MTLADYRGYRTHPSPRLRRQAWRDFWHGSAVFVLAFIIGALLVADGTLVALCAGWITP